MTQADEKQIMALAQRILVKSAHKLGGVAALAKHLGMSEGTVGDFIAGKLVPTAEVMLKAVEPLLDDREGQESGSSRASTPGLSSVSR